MAEPARLALGSAQFGMPYGLVAGSDRPSGEDVRSILKRAIESGIDLVDTAAAYGDAERQLGTWCPDATRFRYVTKTLPISRSPVTPDHVEAAVARARESLRHLKTEHLHGLLVHAADDLLTSGGPQLFDGLLRLKAEGCVEKIGVSVYDVPDLEALLARYPLDIVQLPLNVFDQRFATSGLIRDVAQQGIEVHIRSVYLQGLLLTDPERVPSRLAGAAGDIARFHAAASRARSSPVGAALGFVLSTPGVSRVIVGVQSVDMLDASVRAYQAVASQAPAIDYRSFAHVPRAVSDPRRWAPSTSASLPAAR